MLDSVQNLLDIFGDEFIDSKGQRVFADHFLTVEKYVCLYFGCAWAAPAQEFDPMLLDFYEKVNKDRKVIEIIYVNSDEDHGQFNQIVSNVPWIAIPYKDTRVMELKTMYAITAVPQLIVIRKNGTILTVNGRDDIYAMDSEAINHWL